VLLAVLAGYAGLSLHVYAHDLMEPADEDCSLCLQAPVSKATCPTSMRALTPASLPWSVPVQPGSAPHRFRATCEARAPPPLAR